MRHEPAPVPRRGRWRAVAGWLYWWGAPLLLIVLAAVTVVGVVRLIGYY